MLTCGPHFRSPRQLRVFADRYWARKMSCLCSPCRHLVVGCLTTFVQGSPSHCQAGNKRKSYQERPCRERKRLCLTDDKKRQHCAFASWWRVVSRSQPSQDRCCVPSRDTPELDSRRTSAAESQRVGHIEASKMLLAPGLKRACIGCLRHGPGRWRRPSASPTGRAYASTCSRYCCTGCMSRTLPQVALPLSCELFCEVDVLVSCRVGGERALVWAGFHSPFAPSTSIPPDQPDPVFLCCQTVRSYMVTARHSAKPTHRLSR